jgi:orotidine-5'-phosphate decarboxylase
LVCNLFQKQELRVQTFIDRLIGGIRRCGNPVLVGLDPRYELLPAALRGTGADAAAPAVAAAYQKFCCAVIDVVAPLVAAVKPQAAFFEECGPAGMAALHAVIQHARQHGLLVIVDGKRNDIGSTAAAYAAGFLGADSPWGADALTVNPYLGHDSLTPFVEQAQRCRAGVFVLVKTSNPGGCQFQDLDTRAACDGAPPPVALGPQPLYLRVAQYVEQLAADSAGSAAYGAVGAVVGATYPQQLAELRAAMPHAWLLVPGYGAQGATARDVAAAFDPQGLGAIVNNSRGILFAYRREPYSTRFGESGWQQAVEAATRDMIGELRVHTPAGRLSIAP